MSDHKPPRDVVGERETVLMLLDYHRRSLLAKLDGLTDEQAAWSPVPSGTSLRWLLHHLTGAERLWVLHRYAGREIAPTPHSAQATLEEDRQSYIATWSDVDEVIRQASTLDGLTVRDAGGSPVTLRWVLVHLLEETARHAGHADILRELLDGQTCR